MGYAGRLALVGANLPGRTAALDLGEAYTGVAISDPGGTLARPLEVVPTEGLTDYLTGLLAEQSVSEVLVGLPKTLGGEVGFQAERVLAVLRGLEETFPDTRFVTWDERLTTRIARATTKKRGRKRRAGRERVDHLAAAGMLQEYLDGRGTLEAAR